ncbi:phage lytic cycle repressor MrpR family protein [Oceanobacillus kimchii]|uniref:MrpR N-terminal core-binding domain-containing protein n=1 Tax=Oceanobacillus kimchii TaxID=746691 RepID=A0ABQ5TIU1_9BACI|nr:hypothetical protein [Oceanobacillus kimchii]GLO66196.1 hypothetical protein MACH08_19800 [Oceanobacillus kimchii]
MENLYQANNKVEFLNELNTSTQHIYRWLFNKTYDYENKFGKDIFDFNKNEVTDFYKGQAWRLSTMYVYNSYLNTYVKWAIRKNLKRIERVGVPEITKDDLKEIALLSYDVIHPEIIMELTGKMRQGQNFPPLINNQDKFLLYLIFIGVNGTRCHELINLKPEHFDLENKKILLSKLDSDRKDINIDNFGIDLFKKAMAETEYHVFSPEQKQRVDFYKLEDNGYVFRNSTTGVKSSGKQISFGSIRHRLSKMAEYTGERLTIKQITKSGMVYLGKLLADKGITLSSTVPAVQRNIFDRFDITNEQTQFRTIRQLKEDMNKVYGAKDSE